MDQDKTTKRVKNGCLANTLCLLLILAPLGCGSNAAREEDTAGITDEGTVIGVAEGDPRFTLGVIQQGEVLPSGLVVLLESQLARLSVFGLDGEFAGEWDRLGQGPSEFRSMTALTTGSENEIWILDARNRRISGFVVAEEGPEFEESISLDFLGRDLCRMGDTTFVLGNVDGKIIHRLSPDGKVVDSFGKGVFRDSPVVDYAMSSMGSLACDQERKALFVAQRGHPRLRALDTKGVLLWELEIPGFLPMNIELVGNMGYKLSVPEEGVYHLVRDLRIEDDLWVAEVQELVPDGDLNQQGHFLQFSISPETGEIATISSGPFRQVGVYEGRRISFSNHPFPMLRIGSETDVLPIETEIR